MQIVKSGALVLCACALVSASAATYYVDAVGGSDANDGTSAADAGGGVGPKLTVEAGIACLKAKKDELVLAP